MPHPLPCYYATSPYQVDEAWLDEAAADLDSHWVPRLRDGGGGTCEPLLHTSVPATVSALGARPHMGARGDGARGVQPSGGILAAKGQQEQLLLQPPSPGRSEASHASSAQGQTREAALRELVEEWGCTDPKVAEALMRRRQKMQRAKRSNERRQNLQDPMRRLAALQHKMAMLPPQAEAKYAPRRPLVLARHAPGTAENARMQWLPREGAAAAREAKCRLSPRRRWLGDEGAGYLAGGEAEAEARSVHEETLQEMPDNLELELELELPFVASCAADERELYDEPPRDFASDAPNAKLARSMRPAPRAPGYTPLRDHTERRGGTSPLPTGAWSLNGSRLSSPTVHGTSLPVGSALQVVRSSSAGRFSGT